MNYERMLEGINALYFAAGVNVPVSESGVTMPWHLLRHTFGTEVRGPARARTRAGAQGADGPRVGCHDHALRDRH